MLNINRKNKMDKIQNVKFGNVDEYISLFPENIQKKLEEIRQTIKESLPESAEIISYNMPAYKMKSVLVYFAANKNHIGFYPTPSGIEKFKSEFGDLKWSKGAVQFPIEKELPLNLIKRICKFRLEEDKLKK